MTKINVIVSFGVKKQTIEVNNESTLEDFSRQIERIFGVAVSKQKLIFKGKKLDDKKGLLKDFKLNNNSKVMLISVEAASEDKEEEEEDEESVEGRLERVEKEVKRLQALFFNITSRPQQGQKELSRELAGVAESFTRQLEVLDSISLGASPPEFKSKRKALVDSILASLQSCDDAIKKTQAPE